MARCQDIIRRALRSMGVLQAGQEPAGPDASDGMERLQSLLLDLPGLIQNARWCEVAISAAYTAIEGARVTVTAPGVVTLPDVVTCDGRARPPLDLARIQISGTADNAGIWIYSATKAEWGRVDDLTLTDDIPFGDEDVEGLAALLAVNMSDEFGDTATIGPRTLALAGTSARSFRARFKKAAPRDWTRPHVDGAVRCDDYA